MNDTSIFAIFLHGFGAALVSLYKIRMSEQGKFYKCIGILWNTLTSLEKNSIICKESVCFATGKRTEIHINFYTIFFDYIGGIQNGQSL